MSPRFNALAFALWVFIGLCGSVGAQQVYKCKARTGSSQVSFQDFPCEQGASIRAPSSQAPAILAPQQTLGDQGRPHVAQLQREFDRAIDSGDLAKAGRLASTPEQHLALQASVAQYYEQQAAKVDRRANRQGGRIPPFGIGAPSGLQNPAPVGSRPVSGLSNRPTALSGPSNPIAGTEQRAWRDCVPNSIGAGGCDSIGPGGGRSIGAGGGQSIGPGGGQSIGSGGGQSIGPGGGQSIGPGGGQAMTRDRRFGLDPNTLRPYPCSAGGRC